MMNLMSVDDKVVIAFKRVEKNGDEVMIDDGEGELVYLLLTATTLFMGKVPRESAMADYLYFKGGQYNMERDEFIDKYVNGESDVETQSKT